jgi:hypothetical protein
VAVENEIAEKELAGEIYLAVARLNELISHAAHKLRLRTDVGVQTVQQVGAAQRDRITVTVFKNSNTKG